MVVRHLNPSSCAFTLCLHDSRFVLLSAAFAVQIFRPKELATVATISTEYFSIVLFGITSVSVMKLFSRDDVDDVDGSTEMNPPVTGSRDIELGPRN